MVKHLIGIIPVNSLLFTQRVQNLCGQHESMPTGVEFGQIITNI